MIGQAVDNRGPVAATEHYPIHRPAPTFTDQVTRVEVFETGVKVIDLMCAVRASGGKVGLFGGAGVGKTVTMLELISSTSRIEHAGYVGLCRRRASAPAKATSFYYEMRDAGVLDKISHGVRSDERTTRRPAARAALSGLTLAEKFRDEGRDVLLFIDNIYRYT